MENLFGSCDVLAYFVAARLQRWIIRGGRHHLYLLAADLIVAFCHLEQL